MNLVKLLSEHHTHIGPVSGAWTCTCGEVSTNGSIGNDDLTTRNERCAEHDAHRAEAILSALGSDEMRETVARAIRENLQIGPFGPNSAAIVARNGSVHLTGTEAAEGSRAALAAVVDALRGTS